MKFLIVLALIFIGCSENNVSKKEKPNYDRLWKLREKIIQAESDDRIDIVQDSIEHRHNHGIWLSYDSSNNLRRLVEKFDYSEFSEAYTCFFKEDSLFCLEYDNVNTKGFMNASTLYFFENGDTIMYPIETPKIASTNPLNHLGMLNFLYNQYKKRKP